MKKVVTTLLLARLFLLGITIYKRLTNLSQHKRQNKIMDAKWIFPNTHLFYSGLYQFELDYLQTAHNFEMCYSNSVSRRSQEVRMI